jgi:hypothetical protein
MKEALGKKRKGMTAEQRCNGMLKRPHAPMVTSRECSKTDMLANNHITNS